ncbi:MAG TPA: ABC transporter permease [Anaerolineaceae bacterium]|nr:ABC transporter permease [Anaerolineaceae bacterium]HQH84317.1 ABC transporter permease [Anaerolineaceae bacterium]
MMRLWNVFIKCAREQKRDLWVLMLSLAFAPLFVFVYWLMTSAGGSTTYGLLIINQDKGYQNLRAGEALVSQLKDFSYENGAPFLKVIEEIDLTTAEERLHNREAAALLIIPENFSEVVDGMEEGREVGPTSLEFVGDLTYPTYTIAAVSAMTVSETYLTSMSKINRPIGFLETPLGASASRSEFENYMPGLFIFAVVITIFQAAMLVARESEGGKLTRLRMAGVSSFEFLGGISAWLVLVSIISAGLTFATAVALGFTSQGPLWLAVIIIVFTSFSIIGTGLIVASFAKSVSQAFVIANFPLGFLMFLTGAAFPLPRTSLFTIAGHEVAFADILPPTHAVIALNKIFTLGAGFSDVVFELTALIALSVLYFAIGVILFRRINLR